MLKKIIGLKILLVLSFLAIMTGCSNKEDEVKTLKAELAQTQKELQELQGRYEAMSADIMRTKTSKKDLETQLNSAGNTSQSIEEQLYMYAQQVTMLQQQVQTLNNTIAEQENIILEQEDIIAEQEAALQEFIGSTTEETPYYYY